MRFIDENFINCSVQKKLLNYYRPLSKFDVYKYSSFDWCYLSHKNSDLLSRLT